MGRGPDLVLIHGTGTDAESWNPLIPLLQDRVRLTSFHRRGTAAWPIADGPTPTCARDHAADLADVIESLGNSPVYICGASFGAVVALELAREQPDLIRGAALFEPAIEDHDGTPVVPTAMLAQFDEWIRRGRPEEAAEQFHRRVLSDAVWERVPTESKERARGQWEHIRIDLVASAAYRVRYDALGDVDLPVLLLRGGRSRAVFEASLNALAAALPQAQLDVIEHAGHQLVGPAWRDLAERLSDFMGV